MLNPNIIYYYIFSREFAALFRLATRWQRVTINTLTEFQNVVLD